MTLIKLIYSMNLANWYSIYSFLYLILLFMLNILYYHSISKCGGKKPLCGVMIVLAKKTSMIVEVVGIELDTIYKQLVCIII